MAMVVKNNMSAVNTLNTLNKNQGALGKSLAKVSSGVKINSAQDDASGYAISERMRVMVRALDQATQNTQNGSAMMKVAEGAVANTIEILKTLKEKAINAATDTNTDDDRATIQKEIDQFIDQVNDNALATFNGKYLVDGSKGVKVLSDTSTVMLNQSLAKDATTDTALTALTDRAGNSLNIVEGDTIKVSWVVQGKTYTTASDLIVTSTDPTAATANVNKLGHLFQFMNSSGTYNTAIGSEDGQNILTAATVSEYTSGDLEDTNTMGTNSAGVKIPTPNGEAGIKLTQYLKNTGNDSETGKALDGQISAVTITVIDQYGNAKKSANERLEFKTTIFAANAQTNDQSLKLHVGAAAGQTISVGLKDMRAEALGLQNKDASVISVATPEKANAAIAAFDNALQKALDQATTIGAIEARLEYTASNLTTESENVQSAESTIRDADMAKEMTNYTKNNVLLQAAQSMLAQANQNSSAVLSLLQ
ncbi:MAG: flagellin [Selenomonadaceae bacterium]|nr:flagellin [Selenomonadaceae bacterium]